MATSALADGHGLRGLGQAAGVLTSGILAVRRLPFRVVVIVAAATTAVLRMCGVS